MTGTRQHTARRWIGAAVAAVFALAALASPASADDVSTMEYHEKCWNGIGNAYGIDLPNKSDLNISAYVCVKQNGPYIWASVLVKWDADSWPTFGSGHKFDGVKVQARLERRPNGSSTDTVVSTKTCDLTAEVNSTWRNLGGVDCRTPNYTGYSSAYDWSSDGYLVWDIDNDGESWKPTKQLHGSSLLY